MARTPESGPGVERCRWRGRARPGAAGSPALRPLQSPAAPRPVLLFPPWPVMDRPAAALGCSPLSEQSPEPTPAGTLRLRLWVPMSDSCLSPRVQPGQGWGSYLREKVLGGGAGPDSSEAPPARASQEVWVSSSDRLPSLPAAGTDISPPHQKPPPLPLPALRPPQRRFQGNPWLPAAPSGSPLLEPGACVPVQMVVCHRHEFPENLGGVGPPERCP